VALKVPHLGSDEGAQALARFLAEGRTAGTLRHPNICPVWVVKGFALPVAKTGGL
jgi:hypothetical protein